MVLVDLGHIHRIQRSVPLSEPDPSIELRVAGELPIKPGMPIRISPISLRSKKSRSCSATGFEPVGFVDDQQLSAGLVVYIVLVHHAEIGVDELVRDGPGRCWRRRRCRPRSPPTSTGSPTRSISEASCARWSTRPRFQWLRRLQEVTDGPMLD